MNDSINFQAGDDLTNREYFHIVRSNLRGGRLSEN